MLYSLHLLRTIAAIMVVAYHASGVFALDKYFNDDFLYNILSFGDAGVEIFFVLSGFVIAYAHSKDIGKPANVRAYILKRVIRIYPVYWFVFLSVFFVGSSLGFSDKLPNDWIVLIKSLLLFPMDKEVVGGTGAPVIVVAWSLQYEMMFYFIFSIAIAWKSKGYVFLSVIILTTPFVFGGGFFYDMIFSLYTINFLLGVLVFYTLRVFPRGRECLVLGIGMFVVLAVMEIYYGQGFSTYRSVLYGISAAFVLMGVVGMENKGFDFKNKFFSMGGNASYSMYILHFPVLSVVAKIAVGLELEGRIHMISVFLFSIVLVFSLSIFIFYFLERPMTRYLRRILGV